MSDPKREIDSDDVAQITIFVLKDKVADDLPEQIEHLICPDDGDDHDCALLAMSRHPVHDPEARIVVPIHGDPDALYSVRKRLMRQVRAHALQTDKWLAAKDAGNTDTVVDEAWLGHNMAAHYANVLAAVLRIAKDKGIDPDDLALDVAMMLADGDMADDHNSDMVVE